MYTMTASQLILDIIISCVHHALENITCSRIHSNFKPHYLTI